MKLKMRKYTLEPDLVTPGRYYIWETTEYYTRTAMVIYSDFELANRILKYLQEDNASNE